MGLHNLLTRTHTTIVLYNCNMPRPPTPYHPCTTPRVRYGTHAHAPDHTRSALTVTTRLPATDSLLSYKIRVDPLRMERALRSHVGAWRFFDAFPLAVEAFGVRSFGLSLCHVGPTAAPLPPQCCPTAAPVLPDCRPTAASLPPHCWACTSLK